MQELSFIGVWNPEAGQYIPVPESYNTRGRPVSENDLYTDLIVRAAKSRPDSWKIIQMIDEITRFLHPFEEKDIYEQTPLGYCVAFFQNEIQYVLKDSYLLERPLLIKSACLIMTEKRNGAASIQYLYGTGEDEVALLMDRYKTFLKGGV